MLCERIRMQVHQHPSYDRRRSVPPCPVYLRQPRKRVFFFLTAQALTTMADTIITCVDSRYVGLSTTPRRGLGRSRNDGDGRKGRRRRRHGESPMHDSHCRVSPRTHAHHAYLPTHRSSPHAHAHLCMRTHHTRPPACTSATHTCPPVHHPSSHAHPHSRTSAHTCAFTPTTYACPPAHQPSPPPPASNDDDAHSSPSEDSQHPGPAYRRQPSKCLFPFLLLYNYSIATPAYRRQLAQQVFILFTPTSSVATMMIDPSFSPSRWTPTHVMMTSQRWRLELLCSTFILHLVYSVLFS